jgi:4-carboxymuconolactone decarboxylase
MSDRNRYERGIEVLKEIGGPDYAAPLAALKDTAPELVRYTVEFAYGDVMSRPALDLKTRQLATVAALTAMACAPAQLRFHINGALNVGCSAEEIVEVVMLSAVYAGFPAAFAGLTLATEIFEARGLRIRSAEVEQTADRHARGMRILEATAGSAGAAMVDRFREISPDLVRFIIEFAYGDVIARPVLTDRSKALCTVALLTALATAQPQLKLQIAAALHIGVSREEIVEAIQQMAVYAGFPAALNGIGAAKQVFAASLPT